MAAFECEAWVGLGFRFHSKNMTQLDPVATPPVPHTNAVLTTKKGKFFFPKRCLNKVCNIILPSKSNCSFWGPIFFQNQVPSRTSGDCIASAKNLSP